MLVNAMLGAVVNFIVLVALPILGYYLFHKLRHKRRFGEIAARAGLQVGEPRYLAYAAIVSLLLAVALVVLVRDVEPLTREGSSMSEFAGLGLSLQTVLLALIYGVVKTGFCEELLFRGLIAGSLGRGLGIVWGNLLQALIFLLPHLAILAIAPALWPLLILIFAFGLFKGWLRIRSGSILGPWLLHATGNVTTVLLVASLTPLA